MQRRLCLAHLPTPIEQPKRLAQAMGIDLWVKRDDMSAGAEAGNKIRKLEFLLADALDTGCDWVITCGGIQSNHARATALCAASLGLRSLLLLRTNDLTHLPLSGNVLLDRMAGAEIRLITPEQYKDRNHLMALAAQELSAGGARPYIIPEGGSNGLGALGYVQAMAEVRRQLDVGLAGGRPFDVIVHACGSGGTAAGITLGASRYEVAEEVRTMAVCDDIPTFERIIDDIIEQARFLDVRLTGRAELVVDDRAKGPAYAMTTPEQRRRIVDVGKLSGLMLDPVYTGKAFCALWDLVEEGAFRGERVLFVHTGGLPGLIAQAGSFTDALVG